MNCFHSVGRTALAVAMILGMLATSAPFALAQQDQAAQGQRRPPTVEDTIIAFRDKLRISGQAQERAWDNLAQVMRDNASRMQSKVSQWANSAQSMNAIQNLRAHADMADLQAQSYARLIPAFEGLYNTLNDEQRRTMDSLFIMPQGGPQGGQQQGAPKSGPAKKAK